MFFVPTIHSNLIFGDEMTISVSRHKVSSLEHEVLNHVVECAEHHIPSFLSSYSTMCEHSAQLNWLFQFILNKRCVEAQSYSTYFCQSGLEALLDTVVTMSEDHKNNHSPEILLVSNSRKVQALFPSDHIASNPNIYAHTFAVTENDALLALAAQASKTQTVIYAPSKLPDHFLYRSLASYTQQRHINFVLDASECPLGRIDATLSCHEHKPDVVIWGESIGHQSLPFGAITVKNTEQLLMRWQYYSENSLKIGGSNIAWSFVVKQLLNDRLFEAQLDIIKDQFKKFRKQTFERQVMPKFEHANGLYLSYTQDNKKCRYIDCLQSGGTGVKGHNPTDFARHLRSEHKPGHDYWDELLTQLRKLTGLHDALPAVSGASACHMALALGLNANKNKVKLVVIHDGDTTNISRVAKAYANTAFISQNDPEATELLRRQLNTGSTGLVWLECSYNVNSTGLSQLIELINQRKSADSFFVGVNESRYGLYRSGRLFSHHGSLAPDIITLANGLGAMMMPTAVCMVSKPFAQKIKALFPQVYHFYQNHYRNAIAAHVAKLSLQYMQKDNIEHNVEQVGHHLRQGLTKICDDNRIICAVDGKGLVIRLTLNNSLWPLRLLGWLTKDSAQFNQAYFNHLCITRAKMVPFDCELTPPLNCSKLQAEEIISRLEKVILMNHWDTLRKGIKFLMKYRSQNPST